MYTLCLTSLPSSQYTSLYFKQKMQWIRDPRMEVRENQMKNKKQNKITRLRENKKHQLLQIYNIKGTEDKNLEITIKVVRSICKGLKKKR